MAELGWVDIDEVGASGTYRLAPVSSSHRVTLINIPGTDEFYLLENRQDLESDSAQMNPARGARAKLPGLLVWHVDEGQVEAHGFRGDNAVNAGSPHGVALLQADGLGNLELSGSLSASNRGDAGDSYPGSTVNRRITLASSPAALDNQRRYAGFILDSIYQVAPHGDVVFRLTFKQPDAFAASPGGARIRVNGVALASFSDVIVPGDAVALSGDSLQVSADGRSRFEFTRWSDGGALTHLYRATTSPAAITAVFGADYRLSVALVNAQPGAVMMAAPPPGTDLATGVFLSSGTAVTLTAVPPPGAVFAGWRGDTTSVSPTLQLGMARPYNLTATFVAQVNVAVDAAANTLLGTGGLSAEQSAYLDARGNRNGVYDLGDFLAYVKASGASPSAAVMRQLLTVAPKKAHP